MRMGETTYVPVQVSGVPPIHPSLPPRPAFDIALANPAASSTGPQTPAPAGNEGIKLATNHDVVANRRALRMANMSAAEMLKAELAGKATLHVKSESSPSPTKSIGSPPKPESSFSQEGDIVVPFVAPNKSDMLVELPPIHLPSAGPVTSYDDYANMDVIPGLGGQSIESEHKPLLDPPSIFSPPTEMPTEPPEPKGSAPLDLTPTEIIPPNDDAESMDTDVSGNAENAVNGDSSPHGVKRKHAEVEEAEVEDGFAIEPEEDEAPDVPDAPVARKVNPDGTVEQEDTVR